MFQFKIINRKKNSHFNPLNFIGLPLYRLFYFLISSLFSFVIKTFHRLKKTSTFFKSIKFQLPVFKLSLPKLQLPSLKTSHIFSLFIFSSISVFIYFQIFHQLPHPQNLIENPPQLTTQILDRHENLLYKIYLEENRTLTNIDTLPSHVKQAFLAAEDKNFYNHYGFSVSGIVRSFLKNTQLFLSNSSSSSVEQLYGGSTITQQLVKNALLSPEKTLTRKIKELILAIHTEIIFDKDTIFEMYLNQIAFGGPVYGIQAASQQYFGINAQNLSIPQSAFLAGLTKAPSKYSPYGSDPQLAQQRQLLVLNQMKKLSFISEDQHQQALQEKLSIHPNSIPIQAPHFVMYVKNILEQEFGQNLVNQGGLIVTTTLDLTLQQKAEETLNQQLSQLSSLHITNGAILITQPQTGQILTMIGSRNYFDSSIDGNVNLTTSLRQPGSAIKPLNYALGLENGLTPASLIKDQPLTINLPGSEPWSPKNYDNRFHGTLTLRKALANSYNIPAVVVLSKNGTSNFAQFAQELGITTWDDPSRYGLSMTLGSLEVKMTELAQAYSSFANSGQSIPLNTILSITDSQGNPLPPPSLPSPQQVITPQTAFLISDILADNQARSAAFGYNSILNLFPYKVAVKTGTSNDMRDNWTIGYTPDYLVATWVGNNDNSPMSYVASGITGASPIWNKIITYLLDKHVDTLASFTTPPDLIKIPICSITGTLPCSGCPTRYEYFTQGTQPIKACDPSLMNQDKPTPTTSPTSDILQGHQTATN